MKSRNRSHHGACAVSGAVAVARRTAVAGLLMMSTAVAVPARADEAPTAPAPQTTVEELKQRLDTIEKRADEWRTRDSAFHFAGFADAGYADRSGADNGFDLVTFNPIFHYQYQDRILFEAEIEAAVAPDGETTFDMEYSSVDVVLNDHAVLVAGKFLSPIGNFQQNFHPSWINRLASAPVGFGHDGAAPLTEVGVQLRGGYTFAGDRQWTYAVYVGNGPELTAEAGRLSAVEAQGFARDADRSKVFGGRVSVIPLAGLEIGLSGARGKAAITRSDEQDIASDPRRNYQALDVDVGWKWGKSWDFRGEYVRQKLGSAATSLAPDAATWKAWYVQCAYLWPDTAWELVARYGQFRSPDETMKQDQAALGINYRLSAAAIAKVSYELNDGTAGEDTDRNRWLLQLAYGF